MKIKLDENLGNIRVVARLRLAGHDVETVRSQNLSSTDDFSLIKICHCEGRCLITLDRGFSNSFRYKPSNYSGIVVIRLPSSPTPQDLDQAIDTLISGLEEAELEGKLWIIQKNKIWEYQPSQESER
ncbi:MULTISPECIES: DUF5615 family PIN-like protein [Planktothrix]|uniref:DUF5615 domain-containing protein n=2 Tax=Planktothrix TaxID=54304 RepID=A0A073CG37_PLAA1|nr:MULTISPECIES: DUF5615 family PIN-like protein [Planktothrix]KEI67264.1 hypothetical protein A19Y_2337 [Planktothrix agardhii NIVA-CYA 126/8]CAD5954812.1 hypothetical protein NIVACYA_03242 [Planktothrix agardhii]VXD24990.1 conserved hypothetical protein [Planktothrix paucivesiculata PCC 9631]